MCKIYKSRLCTYVELNIEQYPMAKVHMYVPMVCRYHTWSHSTGWACTTRKKQLLLHWAIRPGNWEWTDRIRPTSLSQSDTNGWQAEEVDRAAGYDESLHCTVVTLALTALCSYCPCNHLCVLPYKSATSVHRLKGAILAIYYVRTCKWIACLSQIARKHPYLWS